jgi:hypothetical protein
MLVKNPKDRISPADLLTSDPWINKYADKSDELEKSAPNLCQPCRVVIEKINLENLRKQYKNLKLKEPSLVFQSQIQSGGIGSVKTKRANNSKPKKKTKQIKPVDRVARVSCKPCKVVISRRHLNEISKEYKNLKIRASISDRLKGHFYF